MSNVTAQEEGSKSVHDKMIEKTQDVRLQIIDKLTADGVPTDSRTVRLLNEVMSSGDTTALAAQRLDSDDKNADLDRQAAMLIGEMFERKPKDPRRVEIPINADKRMEEVELPAIEINPGETSTTASDMNYDKFMKDFDADSVD